MFISYETGPERHFVPDTHRIVRDGLDRHLQGVMVIAREALNKHMSPDDLERLSIDYHWAVKTYAEVTEHGELKPYEAYKHLETRASEGPERTVERQGYKLVLQGLMETTHYDMYEFNSEDPKNLTADQATAVLREALRRCLVFMNPSICQRAWSIPS